MPKNKKKKNHLVSNSEVAIIQAMNKRMDDLEASLAVTDDVVDTLEKKRKIYHNTFGIMFRKHTRLQTDINSSHEKIDNVRNIIDTIRQRQNINCGDILGIESTLNHLLDDDWEIEEEDIQDADVVEEENEETEEKEKIDSDTPLLTKISGVTDEHDARQAIKKDQEEKKKLKEKIKLSDIKNTNKKLEGYNLSRQLKG